MQLWPPRPQQQSQSMAGEAPPAAGQGLSPPSCGTTSCQRQETTTGCCSWCPSAPSNRTGAGSSSTAGLQHKALRKHISAACCSHIYLYTNKHTPCRLFFLEMKSPFLFSDYHLFSLLPQHWKHTAEQCYCLNTNPSLFKWVYTLILNNHRCSLQAVLL